MPPRQYVYGNGPAPIGVTPGVAVQEYNPSLTSITIGGTVFPGGSYAAAQSHAELQQEMIEADSQAFMAGSGLALGALDVYAESLYGVTRNPNEPDGSLRARIGRLIATPPPSAFFSTADSMMYGFDIHFAGSASVDVEYIPASKIPVGVVVSVSHCPAGGVLVTAKLTNGAGTHQWLLPKEFEQLQIGETLYYTPSQRGFEVPKPKAPSKTSWERILENDDE